MVSTTRAITKQLVERAVEAARQEFVTPTDIYSEFALTMPTLLKLAKKFGIDTSGVQENIDKAAPKLWERPCSKCGKPERRSVGLFRCKMCRFKASTIYNAPDSAYLGAEVSSPRRRQRGGRE